MENMKSSKVLLFASIAILLPLLLSSCVLFPEKYRPVLYYDLGNPDTASEESGIFIDSVTTNGPYKFNMVFREKNNLLCIDSYNKWAQIPDALLENYLISALGASAKDMAGASRIGVSVKILRFEADLTGEKPEAVLGVEYSVFDSKSEISERSSLRRFKTEMKSGTPEAFAEAISKSSADFAAELKQSISTLKQREAKP